jgi:Transglutaminase-like superfamily
MATRGSFLLEFFRAALVAPRVEILRRRRSLHLAAAKARSAAWASPTRSSDQRLTLRRAIATVDAFFPGGPNCLRRSLMEVALDRGAADEKLLAGFRSHGGARSGHAWLESEPHQESYDAVFSV